MAVVPPTVMSSDTGPDLHSDGMGRSVADVVPPDTGMGALSVVGVRFVLPVDEQAAETSPSTTAASGTVNRLATGQW
jgi:hypothetical protein